MAHEIQGEFFEDLTIKDENLKSSRKKPVANIQKTMFGMYPKVFFVFLIFIFLGLIIAYALGVENGKKASIYKIPVQNKVLPEEEIYVIQTKEKQAVKLPETGNAAIVEITEPSIEKKADDTKDLPFTVQIVAYKKESSAEKKAKEIEKSGEKVFIIPNKTKTWYQVCVGAFETRKQAKVLEEKLEKKYKGCFVREK